MAQRLHEQNINQVVSEALEKAKVTVGDLDAIATTVKPGINYWYVPFLVKLSIVVYKVQGIKKKYLINFKVNWLMKLYVIFNPFPVPSFF